MPIGYAQRWHGLRPPLRLRIIRRSANGVDHSIHSTAARMGIEPGTVKSYRLSLYRKLGCRPPQPPDTVFEPHTIVARAWEIIEGARKVDG